MKSAITDLMNMQLLNETQIQRATELAFKYRITIYDSVYLAMAETGEMTFYTANDKLLTKTAQPRIRHIRDYGTT